MRFTGTNPRFVENSRCSCLHPPAWPVFLLHQQCCSRNKMNEVHNNDANKMWSLIIYKIQITNTIYVRRLIMKLKLNKIHILFHCKYCQKYHCDSNKNAHGKGDQNISLNNCMNDYWRQGNYKQEFMIQIEWRWIWFLCFTYQSQIVSEGAQFLCFDYHI